MLYSGRFTFELTYLLSLASKINSSFKNEMILELKFKVENTFSI
jgi:hypothetical protein